MSKFCYIKRLESLNGVSRFISIKDKRWNVGSEVKVFFVGGSSASQDVVRFVMRELETLSNIKFRQVGDQNESDIRVSFVPNIGSWSNLGVDALLVSKSNPTMNFGWDIRDDLGTIRHEFGHALGFGHEHSNPDNPPKWNREVVIKDMTQAGWSMADIEHNIFNSYTYSDLEYFSSRDLRSVMHYFYPSSWTTDGEVIGKNDDWSDVDREGLLKVYPFIPIVECEDNSKELDPLLKSLKSIFLNKSSRCLRKRILKDVADHLSLDRSGTKSKLIHKIIKHLNSYGS